jgi:membrane-associated protein
VPWDVSTVVTDIGPVVLLVATLVAFAESALGLGVLLPGEVVFAAMGAAAVGVDEGGAVVAAVVVGAMAGDQAGYRVGRRWGPQVRDSRVVARLGRRRWDRVHELLLEHGVVTFVAGRWVPGVRTAVPLMAGSARLPMTTFLTGSLLGATLWAVWWVGTGGVAARVADAVGVPPVLLVLVVCGSFWLLGLAVRTVRARR